MFDLTATRVLATAGQALRRALERASCALSQTIGGARQRRALGDLDDRLLRDIGLSRDEARREAAKPAWRR